MPDTNPGKTSGQTIQIVAESKHMPTIAKAAQGTKMTKVTDSEFGSSRFTKTPHMANKNPTYSAGVKTDDKSNGMMCIGEKNRHIQQTESVSGTKNVFENDVRQNRADKSAVHDIAKDIKLNYQVKTCAFILRLKKHLRDGMNGYKMEITVGELDKMLTTCYGDPSLKTADLMLRKRACLHKITG